MLGFSPAGILWLMHARYLHAVRLSPYRFELKEIQRFIESRHARIKKTELLAKLDSLSADVIKMQDEFYKICAMLESDDLTKPPSEPDPMTVWTLTTKLQNIEFPTVTDIEGLRAATWNLDPVALKDLDKVAGEEQAWLKVRNVLLTLIDATLPCRSQPWIEDESLLRNLLTATLVRLESLGLDKFKKEMPTKADALETEIQADRAPEKDLRALLGPFSETYPVQELRSRPRVSRAQPLEKHRPDGVRWTRLPLPKGSPGGAHKRSFDDKYGQLSKDVTSAGDARDAQIQEEEVLLEGEKVKRLSSTLRLKLMGLEPKPRKSKSSSEDLRESKNSACSVSSNQARQV